MKAVSDVAIGTDTVNQFKLRSYDRTYAKGHPFITSYILSRLFEPSILSCHHICTVMWLARALHLGSRLQSNFDFVTTYVV